MVSKPLTKKLVLQLCGFTTSTGDYKLVAGSIFQDMSNQIRAGVFVVNQDGIVQKGFVEFPAGLKSGDGTTGVALGSDNHVMTVNPVISVLENPAVSGAATTTSKRGTASSISLTAGVDDNGSPKFILKAKFVVTGPFSATVN